MHIQILLTNEITDQQWQEIVDGFNVSFSSNTTIEWLKVFSTSNHLGYCYHALAIDNDKIVGYNVMTPFLYKNGLKIINSGSSYVLKEYRKDIFIFSDMLNALYERCSLDGFAVSTGVPNMNSFEYSIKFLNCKHIANLDYYILPVNISTILHKRYLLVFDFICKSVIWFYLFFFKTFYNNRIEKATKYEILKSDLFYNNRFKQTEYKKINMDKNTIYYRIVNEDGIKAAYLMDFVDENFSRNTSSLLIGIKDIFKNEAVDIIIFVGTLRIKPSILLKVPPKYVPKRLPFTIKFLTQEAKIKYADMLNMDNWSFSLLNFDGR